MEKRKFSENIYYGLDITNLYMQDNSCHIYGQWELIDQKYGTEQKNTIVYNIDFMQSPLPSTKYLKEPIMKILETKPNPVLSCPSDSQISRFSEWLCCIV